MTIDDALQLPTVDYGWAQLLIFLFAVTLIVLSVVAGNINETPFLWKDNDN